MDYTYGERLFSLKVPGLADSEGKADPGMATMLDQVALATERLRKSPHTRRAT